MNYASSFSKHKFLNGGFMKNFCGIVLFVCLFFTIADSQIKKTGKTKAIFLENISWIEAEKAFKPDSVVVIALGAAAKEHGPHLPLNTDFIQAEYFKDRIAKRSEVIIAPSVNYGFYPPFVEFPGSTTLRLSVSSEMIEDICLSLARYGVKRFYVVNIGLTTNTPLVQAAESLKEQGILLQFTDLQKLLPIVSKDVQKQEKGTHADEIETSQMLYIAPQVVDMKKAVKDYGIEKGSKLRPTRNPNSKFGVYLPSGVFGDATLATREKGKKIVESLLDTMIGEIESLRRTDLPKTQINEKLVEDFSGEFEISSGDTVKIYRQNEFFIAERGGVANILIDYLGKYKLGVGPTEVTFITDANEKITHLILSAGGRNFLAKKIR
jgi:creatinine amidohydrolase